jgi:hypothetical protein
MGRAVVDPAELRRFAHGLKHFNNELQHQLAVMQGQFSAKWSAERLASASGFGWRGSYPSRRNEE